MLWFMITRSSLVTQDAPAVSRSLGGHSVAVVAGQRALAARVNRRRQKQQAENLSFTINVQAPVSYDLSPMGKDSMTHAQIACESRIG
jgi:hypothetical protein